jgi:hypothetical protein
MPSASSSAADAHKGDCGFICGPSSYPAKRSAAIVTSRPTVGVAVRYNRSIGEQQSTQRRPGPCLGGCTSPPPDNSLPLSPINPPRIKDLDIVEHKTTATNQKLSGSEAGSKEISTAGECSTNGGDGHCGGPAPPGALCRGGGVVK